MKRELGVGVVCLLIGLLLGASLVYVFVKAPPRRCPDNTQLDEQSGACVVSCPSGSRWESEFLNCVSDITLEELLTMHGRNYDGKQVRIHGFLTLVSVGGLEIMGLKREYTFVLANNTSGLKGASWIAVRWLTSDIPSEVTASFFLQQQVEVIGTVHFTETQEYRGSVLWFVETPEILADRVTVVSVGS